MDVRNKEVLVVGLGISGLSTIKGLSKLGANIQVTDTKSEDEFKDILKAIEDIPIKKYFGTDDIDLEGVHLIVKSPGVPPYAKVIRDGRKKGIEIVTDIELGFRLSPTDKIIAITGTNGKTTATTLTGEILKRVKPSTYVVGNIGVGILERIVGAKSDDIFVIETSSFQLEDTKLFKPKVSLILNLSPDHIDWHGSYENYINAKKNICRNQDREDYAVLNYDDKMIRTFERELNTNIIWFSLLEKLDRGIYLDGEDIIIRDELGETKVMSISDIKILGKHNLENILGSIGVCHAMGIDNEIICNGIKEFNGVEHRLEYVLEKRGICFYNDSKGTNPDASIKAIEAIEGSIVLIAGGYDKGVEFDEFIRAFNNKIRYLILLGETKDKIRDTALKYGFKDYYLVNNMNEAVNLAYRLSEKGDSVLLSPACASWDMYNSFEERGEDFKEIVYGLKEE